MTRLALIALAFAASTVCAGEPASLFDGAVKIDVPAGFSRLTQTELDKKFAKTARPPVAAFGDASRDTTMAFSLSDQKGAFTASQLPDYVAAMEQILPRVLPGIVWKKKELVTIGGRQWAHLRFAATALDGDAANDTYFTAFRGNILGVNLSSTASKWAGMEPVLIKSFESVQIDDAALAATPASSAGSASAPR